MAFGQGGTYITPIEQAVAYSTFANGGTRYAPQVAAAVVSSPGKVVKRFTPQVVGHVPMSPTNHQAMLAGFEGVVTQPRGTAYGVPGLATSPAGWRARRARPTPWQARSRPPGSWGSAPSANPQYVVVCVIDQAGYGATAAAPVVRQIFDYLAAHPVTAPGVPPSEAVVQNQQPVPLPTLAPPSTTAAGGSTAGTTTTTQTG